MFVMARSDYGLKRNRVEALMYFRGFKYLKEVAEAAGIKARQINRWDSETAIKAADLGALADALETTTDYLIGRTDDSTVKVDPDGLKAKGVGGERGMIYHAPLLLSIDVPVLDWYLTQVPVLAYTLYIVNDHPGAHPTMPVPTSARFTIIANITERDYQDYARTVKALGNAPVGRVEYVDLCEEMVALNTRIMDMLPRGEWDTERLALPDPPRELWERCAQIEGILGI